MPSATPSSRQVWGFRIGRILQFLGLLIGLEALLIFGAEVSEGPMIYTTVLAAAVFYAGWFIARRNTPAEHKRK